jgi:hypothetical protein
MAAKAGTGNDAVVIDDTQRSELNVPGIEVIGERKAVAAFEPTVGGNASLIAGSRGDHRCTPWMMSVSDAVRIVPERALPIEPY